MSCINIAPATAIYSVFLQQALHGRRRTIGLHTLISFDEGFNLHAEWRLTRGRTFQLEMPRVARNRLTLWPKEQDGEVYLAHSSLIMTPSSTIRQLSRLQYVKGYMVANCYIRSLFCLVLLYPALAPSTYAQVGQVGINSTGAAPAGVALLDLRESNAVDRTKGLLIPRIALTATNDPMPVALPASGLYIYNTATSSFTGVNAQYNVTPGFYIWDVNRRWVRHESLVRRPALYSTTAILSTTSGGVCTPITGTISATMDLKAGDRVWMKGYGTATPSGQGYAQGQAELIVDDGTGYTTLPNGSGTTGFSLDNALTVVSASVNVLHRGNYANWGVSGYYDVPGNGTYTFAMGIRRLTGSVNIASGGLNLPGALLIEVVRP